MTTRLVLCLTLITLGCEEGATVEPLTPSSFPAVSQVSAVELSASPAFADERGGGVFVGPNGDVVRLRPNGERGVLEPHPRNVMLPGSATAIFPLGPSNALVATSQGLFVAEQGWLIAPTWQTVLPAEGLLGTAMAPNGVAWLSHSQGLYRLERGLLSEFKVRGEALTGLTGVAVAPVLDGTQGLWFARQGKLFAAAQSGTTDFSVQESGLSGETLKGGVIGLVGLMPSRSIAGELWAITPRALLLYTGRAWREYTLKVSPQRLVSAGRFAWLQAGDRLFRYDADTRGWAEALGLEGPGTLMAADAAGNAWVQVGSQTMSIGPSIPPRVQGLAQGSSVFDGQLVLQAAIPVDLAPESIQWDLDGVVTHSVAFEAGQVGAGPTAGMRLFSLGGIEPGGVLKPVSFAALNDGWHTLTVTTAGAETSSTRRVHFEFLGAATATVSWERDIRELGLQRCNKCHAMDTEPELVTYAQWKEHAAQIASAVRDSRMPADGPLDAAGVAAVVRWANGGAQP